MRRSSSPPPQAAWACSRRRGRSPSTAWAGRARGRSPSPSSALPPAASPSKRRQAMCVRRLPRGLTLVELILFVLIVSIALLGVLLLLNTATARSSNPLVQKQALAVAEALLEEVQLMPFTYCDPDDA